MKKLTKHTRPLVGQTFTIKWGTSRGRDSYGYTTCSLSQNGRTVARCNGGVRGDSWQPTHESDSPGIATSQLRIS